MAQGVEHQCADVRLRAVERVAAAGVVDQLTVRIVGIAAPVVEPAEAECRTVNVAFAGVVEHQVEDHADPGGVERCDRLAQFGHAARAQSGVERHRHHRVVAPGVGQAERGQVALVDPGDHRHQFHRVDMQLAQVGDDRRMRQCGDRSALRLRNVGVKHGQRADAGLVDQPAAAEQRRGRGHNEQGRRHHRLGHQRSGIVAVFGQSGIVVEPAIERHRAGIDQQLGKIAAQPAFRFEIAVGAKAIAAAGPCGGMIEHPVAAVAHHRQPRLRSAVEQAEPDLPGVGRADAKRGHSTSRR